MAGDHAALGAARGDGDGDRGALARLEVDRAGTGRCLPCCGPRRGDRRRCRDRRHRRCDPRLGPHCGAGPHPRQCCRVGSGRGEPRLPDVPRGVGGDVRVEQLGMRGCRHADGAGRRTAVPEGTALADVGGPDSRRHLGGVDVDRRAVADRGGIQLGFTQLREDVQVDRLVRRRHKRLFRGFGWHQPLRDHVGRDRQVNRLIGPGQLGQRQIADRVEAAVGEVGLWRDPGVGDLHRDLHRLDPPSALSWRWSADWPTP